MPTLSFVSDRDAHSPAVAILTRPGDDGVGLTEASSAVAREFDVDLAEQLRRDKARGEAGEVLSIPRLARPGAAAGEAGQAEASGPEVLLVAGTGDASTRSMRRAGAALARRAKAHRKLTVIVSSPAFSTSDSSRSVTPEQLTALAEGLHLGSYAFRRPASDEPTLQHIDLVGEHSAPADAAVHRAGVLAAATCLARDLANTPAGDKPPAWLASRAVEDAAAKGLTTRVWDENALAAEGFGGILAVGAGSERPPRLVELRYVPAGATGPHIVLVGKGITFDSGGLSLKPRETMPAMKTDMSGAAAVIGVMHSLSQLRVQTRVTGLLAIAENVPSGSAYRPSDVLTQYGGTTVEVLNTDAEGRLVLADALAYADTHLDPDIVIDVATLTGAATLSLGRRHAALFSEDTELRDDLRAAGHQSGENVWPMPLVEDYRAALNSDIADLAHISRVPSMSAGAITAALFLREFVGRRRWAHLDIAGPARADGDDHEVSKGGTGFGARLLLTWILARQT